MIGRRVKYPATPIKSSVKRLDVWCAYQQKAIRTSALGQALQVNPRIVEVLYNIQERDGVEIMSGNFTAVYLQVNAMDWCTVQSR
jgi:hypothetical protein